MVTWKSLENFQQEGLESLVRAVKLIDQQNRRTGGIRLERLQQRPLDQKTLRENVALKPLAIVLALSLGGANGDHLRGIIPLVDRGRDVETLITLQADQASPQRCGQHLADLGLADARFAFEKQRPAHFEREVEDGRERAIGQILPLGKERDRCVDRSRQRAGQGFIGHQIHLIWDRVRQRRSVVGGNISDCM